MKTIEKETLEEERQRQTSQTLDKEKPIKEEARDADERCYCDSGVCFESGL